MKKIIKKTIRNYNKFREYSGLDIMDGITGNKEIKKNIFEGKPLMVTRIGSVELEILTNYIDGKKNTKDLLKRSNVNAGIFPPHQSMLEEFSKIFLESLEEADLIGVWYNKNEGNIIKQSCKDVKLTELRALEPYYWSNPWSSALKNKKVLIIHPFAETIKSQMDVREHLFKDKNIIPDFDLEVLKAVQTSGGNTTEFNSWTDALKYMHKEVASIDFDIAIIGAGAYGLPLASFVKNLGKQAIHMGGATQLLFGIKGARWDNHPEISNYYNGFWTRAGIEERPKDFASIEKGCYW